MHTQNTFIYLSTISISLSLPLSLSLSRSLSLSHIHTDTVLSTKYTVDTQDRIWSCVMLLDQHLFLDLTFWTRTQQDIFTCESEPPARVNVILLFHILFHCSVIWSIIVPTFSFILIFCAFRNYHALNPRTIQRHWAVRRTSKQLREYQSSWSHVTSRSEHG